MHFLLEDLLFPFDNGTTNSINRFVAAGVGKIYKIRTEKLRELGAPWLSDKLGNVIVKRPKPMFVEFNGPTVHTATSYAIWKLIECSLRFGMMWNIKMVQLYGKGCSKLAT